MRVLVVEDDRKIGLFVTKALRQAGFVVDYAEDGVCGLEQALATSYDAAVVDVMLPRMDGLSLIDALRRNKLATPVIILSAKRSVDDRVRGLQAGGDDYLVKPFALAELLARVHALIRRSSGGAEPMHLSVGALTMNLLTREVERAGQRIELQQREFSLLEYLMRNANRPVSKTMILEHVWDYHFDTQTNVVDVLVCRLRSKIDRNFPVKMIHTVRGIGYAIKGG
ncbi:DNA-binding response regulator [Trinickia dabaoshanensis]|uniref:DNA-binding response regulator n=1 Tax=Trinickia dabaoshanensis TaxID=564714 RepID=A0A2N7VR95_9BURK|nr:response regulator transcription factor [Trinickia dabaoshanensis]PMS19657.1 DNA-binding response regulator [Trinickia dabaoshanensis]TAM50879.1 MAG: response regulator transcription factor [Paraburkholderia sp.]